MLLGWLRGFAKERGWNGALALPRILTIDADGYPIQNPISEMRQLRGVRHIVGGVMVQAGGSIRLRAENAQVEIILKLRPDHGAVISLVLGDQRIVEYHDGQLTVLGTSTPAPLNAAGVLDLHVFIDRSVIELFANLGRVVITRLLSQERVEMEVTLYSEYGECGIVACEMWDLKSVWV